jgi:hypothetical protein
MQILHSLFKELKKEFTWSRKGKERRSWFIYTLVAIIIPFTSSRTSNLFRTLKTLFGFVDIKKKRYYTFMSSPKIPWKGLWSRVWHMIPEPKTHGRLLIALDDFINPKTGKKIFACSRVFDHAAKLNQSKYPWAQNVVSIGLLKIIKGRWACIPLSYSFYHLKKEIEKNTPAYNGESIAFQSKHTQAVSMITDVAAQFSDANILIVADSWFGNNGMWEPLYRELDKQIHMISRLRANNNLFDIKPKMEIKRKPGRPRIYGDKLGTPSELAGENRDLAQEYQVNLYGRNRNVLAYDRVVMLKTLKRAVRVVWIYRKTRWVALFSTNLTLSVTHIIEYYGARWKIEACFKELKREIGSAETQTRNPVAVTNHLSFCMMATSLTWIYACRLENTPNRRHAVHGRKYFAFSDVRRMLTKDALDSNFALLCPSAGKPLDNSIVTALFRLAA